MTMNILKNTLSVGAETPFVFLHVSDIHLSESDENDSPERRAFAADRKRDFAFAPAAVEFIRNYVKKTGSPIVNTGDMLDFITPENIRIARGLVEDTDMMMAAGNHEYWHCPNNRFSYDDVPETYAGKNRSLAEVERGLGIDIRFSCREIGGVNLVCMDDSDYHIDAELFEKLKAVEAEGKPILLFMHIPLYSAHIGREAKFSLNAPPQYFENCHPVDVFERTPDELTCQICDYIRQSPLIKCVLSGHTHANTEILGLDAQDQIITGCNTIREITVI
ncbi:MAG: metallophosphoesterase [Clostridia bacterium]|nr:metallophosphoesterase [Clostridia bacterium]